MSACMGAIQVGPLPLTSLSRPPDVTHVMNAPRPSPFFFCTLPLPCIILNANRRTKNGVGLGTRLILAVKWTDNAVMLSQNCSILFTLTEEGLAYEVTNQVQVALLAYSSTNMTYLV